MAAPKAKRNPRCKNLTRLKHQNSPCLSIYRQRTQTRKRSCLQLVVEPNRKNGFIKRVSQLVECRAEEKTVHLDRYFGLFLQTDSGKLRWTCVLASLPASSVIIACDVLFHNKFYHD